MSFTVTSVPEGIARQARRAMQSPQYGHPAYAEVARGYGPCRCCLRRFVSGRDRRLLFTFNPFTSGVPAPGPVFVHADHCEPYAGAGFPPDLRDLPLLFEALDASGLPVARRAPGAHTIERAIEALLARPDVGTIVVRNAEAGCYIATIERASAKKDGAARG